MNVAFFADKNALPGLHAALYSCLGHWSLSPALKIHLFHDRLSAQDLAKLERTLVSAGKPFEFLPSVFSPERLKGLKAFHGNWMAYGRLLLPELLPDVSRVIYLDSDLIVNVSLDLFSTLVPDSSAHALAAVSEEPFCESCDRELGIRLGLDGNAPYFNSGVLYLNLDLWRDGRLTEECLQFAKKHGVYDQSALNVVFYKSFFALPVKLNVPLYPESGKVREPEDKIVHFAGSPKPFDIAGRYLNNNSELFYEVLGKTCWRQSGAGIFSSTKLRRLIELRRSYLRVVMRRLGILGKPLNKSL